MAAWAIFAAIGASGFFILSRSQGDCRASAANQIALRRPFRPRETGV